MSPVHESSGAAGGSGGDGERAPQPIARSASTVAIDAAPSDMTAAVMSISKLAVGSAPAMSDGMTALDRLRHDAAIDQLKNSRFKFPPERRLDPRAANKTQTHVQVLERHLDGGRTQEAIEIFGAITALATVCPKKGLSLLERFSKHIHLSPPITRALALFVAAQLHEASGNALEAMKLYQSVLAITDDLKSHRAFSAREIQHLGLVKGRLETLGQSAPVETALLMVKDHLDDGDAKAAETCLITAVLSMQTRRHEIACLQFAGDVSYAKGDLETAIRQYQACASRAALNPDEFAGELQAAREAIKWPQSDADVGGCKRAMDAGQDSQAVLDDLLRQAASDRWKNGADLAKAMRVYDDVIPRLLQREDKRPALDALLERRDMCTNKDPQQAECNLKLAHIYSDWERYPDAAFCLLKVLSSEQAPALFGPSLGLATTMLNFYANEEAEEWCREASLRRHEPEDAKTLEKYIVTLLKDMPAYVEGGIRDGDFEPLCHYAEALVHNLGIDNIFSVCEMLFGPMRNSRFDMQTVQVALERHMKLVASKEVFVYMTVSLRMAIADHERLGNRHSEAASSLLPALETDLSNEPLLARQCLDCAARVVHVAGESCDAAYLARAAQTLAMKGSDAARSKEEQKDAEALQKKLTAELDSDELGTAHKQAWVDTDQGFALVFANAKKFMNDIVVNSGAPLEGA